MQSHIQFFQLLTFRVYCRLKSEVSNTYLNYLWWALEPILYLATFYFVFETLLRRGTEDFVVFLLCGLIPWAWFQKSAQNASSSILHNKGLLTQVRIPIILFPMEVVAQDFVKQFIAFFVLFLFLILYGVSASWTWLAIIPLIVVQLTLILAVAFLLAAIVPIIPDLKYIITTGLLILMFGSGIFYHYETLLPHHQEIFFLNPIAVLIRSYREVLLYNTWPQWDRLFILFTLSLAALYLLYRFFSNSAEYYTQLASEQ